MSGGLCVCGSQLVCVCVSICTHMDRRSFQESQRCEFLRGCVCVVPGLHSPAKEDMVWIRAIDP